MELSTILPTEGDYPDYSETYDTIEKTPGYSASEIISIIVFFVVFLVGVPGNALVVLVTGNEVRKMVNSVWFLNLALADLLCCLVLPFLVVPILRHMNWPFDATTCRILPSVILLNMYASILLLVVISIDRFILVMNPIWCQNHRRVKVAWFACSLAWILAFLLTIPSLKYRSLVEEHFPHKWVCGVIYTNNTSEISVAISRFLLSFLIPLLIISTCYGLLLNRLWMRQATRSQKTINVVMAVVVGFFICWTPYHIVGLLMAVSKNNSHLYSTLERIDSFTIALAYINSCINPVIYVVAGHGIKGRMMSHSICTKLRQALTEDSLGRDSKSFTRSTVGTTAVPEEQL
ncbi:C5a anaphylatoxin chemotactic receptor 1 isoform X2 [Macrotis lagotis]|uniref:C5a anaphylatoxin chemotactic receptor 1 isoform X2 n=1 Tax=Macrotis lagotis TaxID=92651 RepID=UPI003D6891B7